MDREIGFDERIRFTIPYGTKSGQTILMRSLVKDNGRLYNIREINIIGGSVHVCYKIRVGFFVELQDANMKRVLAVDA